jgi:hypothetical protein
MNCRDCGAPLAVNMEPGRVAFEFTLLVYCSSSRCAFWFRVDRRQALAAMLAIYERGDAIQ